MGKRSCTRVLFDWVEGIVVIVPKKGDTSICSNNRGITLRSTASKLYQIIALQHISDGLKALLRDHQRGFRKKLISHQSNLYSLLHHFHQLCSGIINVDFEKTDLTSIKSILSAPSSIRAWSKTFHCIYNRLCRF